MTDQTKNSQVLILGAGPAGLALAAACRHKNLDVRVLDRDHSSWKNQYAAWEDELTSLGREGWFRHVWSSARVWIDEGDERVLARPYGVIDNEHCNQALRAEAQGADWVCGEVEEIRTEGLGGVVTCADGATYSADVIIDVLGTLATPIHAGRSQPTTFQSAYGVLAEVEGTTASDYVTLMDFRDPAPDVEALPGDVPSFLYSMPWPDGRWFFEETVLVAKPAIPVEILKGRLERRLERHGIGLVRIDEVEHCVIGMDVAPPERDCAVLCFGAAAGLVHPATGYSFVESFRRAPRVALAIMEVLESGVTAKSRGVLEDAIWSPDERKCHALFQFGSNAVAGFNAEDTRKFMNAFFALPTERWAAYLSRRLSSSEVQATMLTMFKKFPLRLKRKMTGISLWKPKLLVRGIFGH